MSGSARAGTGGFSRSGRLRSRPSGRDYRSFLRRTRAPDPGHGKRVGGWRIRPAPESRPHDYRIFGQPACHPRPLVCAIARNGGQRTQTRRMPPAPHLLRARTRSPESRITRPPQLYRTPTVRDGTLCYTKFARFYLNPVMSLPPVSEIVCAHSPDSDDAFMFYGLATKKVRSKLVTFRHVLEDIESLNRKATEGLYELTAISYHAY